MKLDPGFTSHWKTERLLDELGGDGVVALLRLWGNAQIRREWSGMELNPKRLAMETKWKGNADHLFQVFTDPDAPWLDRAEDGSYSIHGFEEHQKQVIHLWSAGGKGGRPKKEIPPTPPKEKESSIYPSSSSYPISETNENQMVFEAVEAWNLIEGITHVRDVNTSRKAAFKTRMKDPFFKENWREAMARIPQSKFLTGGGSTGWKANFDWFLNPKSVASIMEGKYSDKQSTLIKQTTFDDSYERVD